MGVRTVRRWVAEFRKSGEAGGVAIDERRGRKSLDGRDNDKRCVQTALEVMAEYTDQSIPDFSTNHRRRRARQYGLSTGYGFNHGPCRQTETDATGAQR